MLLCLQEVTSPEVFISYQWGKQKEISVLYRRLTGLGFTCWMDIHQMGGGDSLYDKIDRGIRGCKVVLTSITQKYALSANCRREVSLADALKKPIIPLLMEKSDWPPSGPMSMVFTQLLFINFCKDEMVQLRWDGPKFDELLQQMHMHIQVIERQKPEAVSIKATTPEETKITKTEKPEDVAEKANDRHQNKTETQTPTKQKQLSSMFAETQVGQPKAVARESKTAATGVVVKSKMKEGDENRSETSHQDSAKQEKKSANERRKSEPEQSNTNRPTIQQNVYKTDNPRVGHHSTKSYRPSQNSNKTEQRIEPPPQATYIPPPSRRSQDQQKNSSTCILL